jgi:hypothetical protein
MFFIPLANTYLLTCEVFETTAYPMGLTLGMRRTCTVHIYRHAPE